MTSSHHGAIVISAIVAISALVACNGVVQPPAPTAIESFTVTPNPVASRGTITLSWRAVNTGLYEGSPYCTLQRTIQSSPADDAQQVDCSDTITAVAPSEATTMTYRLSALKRDGSTYVTRDVTVRVGSADVEPARRLLYSAGLPRGSDSDLYTVNVDGTDPQLLLDTPGWIQSAFWNADRTRIVYTDRLAREDRDLRLAVIGPDGTVVSDESLIRVIGPACCHGGSYVLGWHPDEDSFLFKKEESSCTGNLLWRRYFDGSEEVFLDPAVVSDGVVAFIAFSPGGDEVTWVSQDGCWSPSSAMYRAPMVNGRVDASSIELVYADGQVIRWVEYAADGTLAFQNTDTVPYDYPNNLYLERSGAITRITDFFTADAWVDTFAWSPDGNSIAYSETSNWTTAAENIDIVVINRDGTGRVPVVATPDLWEQVWGW